MVNKRKENSLETMLKDEFQKLENGIFFRKCMELLCEVNMNVRSTISRICLIQSPIYSWFRL
jgi:hypothetical protein